MNQVRFLLETQLFFFFLLLLTMTEGTGHCSRNLLNLFPPAGLAVCGKQSGGNAALLNASEDPC